MPATLTNHNNLPALSVSSDSAIGLIYLHGAHIASWKPRAANRDILWLSQKSHFASDKPIRGGIPICFPWFGARAGDPSAPAHGFARLKPWSWDGKSESINNATRVTLTLAADDHTRSLWPHDFLLTLAATFGETLDVELTLENRGTTDLTAEEALHTYFSVADVRDVTIRGLERITYIDKTDNMNRKVQEGPIRITAETDRVYLGTQGDVTVESAGAAPAHNILISKRGSDDTVVWNPWIAKAKAMPDFGDDEWPHMLCVETCNVGEHALHLRPGRRAAMAAHYQLQAE